MKNLKNIEAHTWNAGGSVGATGLTFKHNGFEISLSPTLPTWEGLSIFDDRGDKRTVTTFALTGQHSLPANAAGIAQAVAAINKFDHHVTTTEQRIEFQALVSARLATIEADEGN